MSLDFEKVDLGSIGVNKELEINPYMDKARMNVRESAGVNPDQHAQRVKLSQESGIPTPAIEGAEDDIQGRLDFSKTDFDKMSADSPNTTKYLSNYDNAVLSGDELTGLQFLENVVTSLASGPKSILTMFDEVGGGFSQGVRNVESSEIGRRRALRALGAPVEGDAKEDLIRVGELNKLSVHKKSDFFEGIPRVLGEQIPIQADILSKSALGAVMVGIPAAIGSRGLLGGVGAKLGAKLGAVKGAFDLEFGLAFNEFAASRDESGGALDQSDAAKGAAVVGAVNAGLEFISMNFFAKRISPLMKRTLRNKVKRAMLSESGLDLVKKLGGTITKGLAVEGTTEALQELTKISMQEVLEFFDDTSFEDPEEQELWESINFQWDKVLEAGKAGMQAGVGFGGIAVTAQVVEHQLANKNLSENEQLNIDKINEASAELKTVDRNKDNFHQFVEESDGDRNTHVHLDGLAVVDYLEQFTPKEIVEDPTLMLLQNRVEEAKQNGTDVAIPDVAIPVADFATDVTGSEHYDSLRPNMTLNPESSSPARQVQDDELMRNRIKRGMDEAIQNSSQYVEAQEVVDQVRDQLVDAGYASVKDATIMADLSAAFVATRAKSTGRSVVELYAEMGLTIEGPQTGKMDELKAREDEVLLQDTELEKLIAEFDTLFPDIETEKLQSVFDTKPEQRQQRLLEISGLGKIASWTSDRLNLVIRNHQHANQQESKARVAFVNPADFVNATHSDPQKIAEDNEQRDKGLSDIQTNDQTPFLRIEGNKIIGHEGRHRMAALSAMGVDRVPIVIIYNEGYQQEDVEHGERRNLLLKGQQFEDGEGVGLEIDEAYLAVSSNKDLITEATGKPDIMFQRVSQQQDFGDINITEEVEVEGTGEKVTITESAQSRFDDVMTRKSTIEKLRDCL